MGAVLRTVVFTLVVPGFVTVWLPRVLLPRNAQWHWDVVGIPGMLLLVLGAAVYLWCAFWAFAWVGRGTPAPMDAPRKLIIHGLYRYVRNPMYIGVGSVILGEALVFHSITLVEYLLVWGLFVHLFVLFYEEPTLQRKFGANYETYRREVRRWLPRHARLKEPS